MLWSNSASDLKDPVVENTEAFGLERVLTEYPADSGEHDGSPFPVPSTVLQRLPARAGKANGDGLPAAGVASVFANATATATLSTKSSWRLTRAAPVSLNET